jgi:transposase
MRRRVERLRCFRGIDDLTALTIAAELGDPRRFATAPRAMAFVGWCRRSIPAARARPAAITKTGNAHLRRVLVEAAWHYRHRPFAGAALRRRQYHAPPAILAHAWTAQQRLHPRYHRLVGRGKVKQQVNTAIARELMGFVWAALIQ